MKEKTNLQKSLDLLLIIACLIMMYLLFSCSKDNNNCNCVKQVYSNPSQMTGEYAADQKNCDNSDSSLHVDQFGSMYKFVCK